MIFLLFFFKLKYLLFMEFIMSWDIAAALVPAIAILVAVACLFRFRFLVGVEWTGCAGGGDGDRDGINGDRSGDGIGVTGNGDRDGDGDRDDDNDCDISSWSSLLASSTVVGVSTCTEKYVLCGQWTCQYNENGLCNQETCRYFWYNKSKQKCLRDKKEIKTTIVFQNFIILINQKTNIWKVN